MRSGGQNVCFLRFFIVLAAIVLSLFLYVFYFSAKTLEIPHIRSNAPESNFNLSNITNWNVARLDGIKTAWNSNVHSAVVKIHRMPTIDVDSPLDTLANVADLKNTLEEQPIKDFQYQEFSERTLGFYNSSFNDPHPLQEIVNSINIIPDTDILVPTSNLQKFIENADRILQNVSSVSLQSKVVDNELITNDMEKLKSQKQPVITSDSNRNQNQTSKTLITPTKSSGQSVSSDPTKGIQTKNIYESGHLDEELNIDQICPNEGVGIQLLILITSAQAHQDARLAIRQTWGHFGSRRDIAVLFVLGRSFNETLNEALINENLIYGDLIRGRFLDTYNNLTLKTISALEWVDRHCAKANFVLKTDDDMFINVPKLLDFLEKHSEEKRVIYGRLAKKWKPIRNKKSKYFVSTEQFTAPLFPPFTTGPAYLMSSDIINDLYQRSLQQTYLKLEDVFTTGIVAQQLGIKRIHGNEFLNRRIAFNPCNIRKAISVHMIKSNEQFDLWRKLLDQNTKCK